MGWNAMGWRMQNSVEWNGNVRESTSRIADYVTGVPKWYTCYEMVFEGKSSPEVAPVASEQRNPVL